MDESIFEITIIPLQKKKDNDTPNGGGDDR